MSKQSESGHICNHAQIPSSAVFQTLDELDFERGIWYAAQNGDLQRVRKLINQGTSTDKRDNSGYTALHYAVRAGYIEMCRFLISKGADVNAVTRSGKATPLHRAATAGKYEIVKMLLDKNADVTLKDNDGKNVLHRAAETQHLAICLEVVKICPKLRTDLDNKGKTPFDYIRNPELAAAMTLKHC